MPRLVRLALPLGLLLCCGCAGESAAPDAAAPAGRHRAALGELTRLTAFPDVPRTGGRANPSRLVSLNGQVLYFQTNPAGTTAPRLMRSDGTAGGTSVVVEHPDLSLTASNPHWLVPFAGSVYWMSSNRLWRSDGTAQGTDVLAVFDHLSFAGGAQTSPTDPFVFDGALYFGVDQALWRSDGTLAGTVKLEDVKVQTSTTLYRYTWRKLDGRLYFRCSTAATGTELCVTDGTPSGTSVLDLLPGTASSAPALISVAGDRLLLSAAKANATGTHLFSTDGTVAGTVEVCPSEPTTIVNTTLRNADVATLGTRAFFPCSTQPALAELCASDGTQAGTSVLDLEPSGASTPSSLHSLNGALYFRTSGGRLWRSDGTVPGSAPLADGAGPITDAIGETAVLGGHLYFARSRAGGMELWRTDGTVPGTSPVDGLAAGAGAVDLKDSALAGSRLLFGVLATDSDFGEELFSTDGTAAGTGLVLDSVLLRWSPKSLVLWHGQAAHYLLWQNGDSPGQPGLLLWRTDGSPEGTTQLAGPYNGTNGVRAATAAGELYFSAAAFGTSSYGLYRLDGSDPDGAALVRPLSAATSGPVAGTAQGLLLNDDNRLYLYAGGVAAEPTPTIPSPSPGGPLASGGVLFSGSQPGLGQELFFSDGTAPGTHLVKELAPGATGASLTAFAPFGDGLLFSATDGVHGRELWRSDGTAANTAMVKDLHPAGDASISGIAAFGAVALFFADDGTGLGLYRTDGTEAGTVRLAPVGHPFARAPVVFGDYAFFAGRTPEHGIELWRTDGTAAGTQLVADLWPGRMDSHPEELTVLGASGPLLFRASTAATGAELFRLDAPLGQPALARDLAPGPAASSPTRLTSHETFVTLLADDEGTGPSLFRWVPGPPDTTPPQLSCPADLAVFTADSQGAVVSWPAPDASDDSGAPPTLSSSHAPGTLFAVGVTTVTVTAEDGAGNAASCSFTVTVIYEGAEPDAGGGGDPDAGLPAADAGPSGAGGGQGEEPGAGCGCGSAAGSGLLPWLVAALLAGLGRRRPRPFSGC